MEKINKRYFHRSITTLLVGLCIYRSARAEIDDEKFNVHKQDSADLFIKKYGADEKLIIYKLKNKLRSSYSVVGGGIKIIGLKTIDNGRKQEGAYRSAENSSNDVIFLNDVESVDGIGFSCVASGVKNFKLIFSDIDAASYGYLSSEPDNNNNSSDGVMLIGNSIKSNRADAIEINNYKSVSTNYIFIGNFLETGFGSDFSGSGFGFGLSGVSNWMFCDNIIKKTRRESIHIEDSQEFGIISNVICSDTGGDGVRILAAAKNKKRNDGLILSNIIFNKIGGGGNDCGVNIVQDNNGSVHANLISNVRSLGHNRAFNFDGGFCCVSNIYAKDSHFAVSVGDGSKVHGSVFSEDCRILIRMGRDAVAPYVVSKTPVEAIIFFPVKQKVYNSTLVGFDFVFDIKIKKGVFYYDLNNWIPPLAGNFLISIKADKKGKFFFQERIIVSDKIITSKMIEY